jgi:hypothetical protein
MNTYLDHLLRNKKSRKSQAFKGKLVEAYRAERVLPSELEEKLGISRTELRRLNRWYYRYRLLPLLHPKNRHRFMKRDPEYVKTLERKIADMEKENQFLRLQAEAYQTVIQIAEEHGAARAV